MFKKINISAIEFDTSIQCRAAIDPATVTDYAEQMTGGVLFPSVILFGTAERCWIGDGWHRVMAAKQIYAEDIEADLREGDRTDALKHALGANATNGLRRTNADKRRCVEIALAEFSQMSSRAVAELCGVSHPTVETVRESVGKIYQLPRTGTDGKTYPPKEPKEPKEPKAKQQSDAVVEVVSEQPAEVTVEQPVQESPEKYPRFKYVPPCRALQCVQIAILNLEEITDDDTEREAAFALLKGWIKDHE